jgi:hypothetical protein
MMKATQNRPGSHAVSRGYLMPDNLQWGRKTPSGLRQAGSQARMWARSIIMDLPFLHDPSQMTLADGNQKIQTIPAQASNQPFAIGIRLGGTERSLERSDSHISDCKIQLPGVNAVSIVNQKPVALFAVDGLPKLLQGPRCSGMGSNIEVDESSRGYLHDDKHIDDPKACRYGDKEIASQHGLRMIADKGYPSLG